MNPMNRPKKKEQVPAQPKPRPVLCIVNGVSYAGKDTFCMFCNQFVSSKVLSTVDYIKDIAESTFDWDGVKDEKGRKLLTDLRKAWNDYNNGSTLHTIHEVLNCKEHDIIFIMIREFDEIMFFINHPLLSKYTKKTIWVDRGPDNLPGETEQLFVNMIPDDYEFNHVIENSQSLSDLFRQAFLFCENTIIRERMVRTADTLAQSFDKARGYTNTIPKTEDRDHLFDDEEDLL